jgi:hypothetical protein
VGYDFGDERRRREQGWSLYGAQRAQPVATARKCSGPENGENKPKPLRTAATGCLRRSMVSRASAVGCHPLREVPSLRRRGSIHLLGGAISCCCSPGTGTGRNRSRCMPCGSRLDFTRFEINPGACRVTVGSLKERCNEQGKRGIWSLQVEKFVLGRTGSENRYRFGSARDDRAPIRSPCVPC